tara:strand:- start:265 stop:489 length:225 start_codon:yes stop_codon:yes gene_type:complete
MSWWNKLVSFFKPLPADELPNPLKEVKKEEPVVEETELVRARNEKGRYVADDPSTPDINEAYTKVKKKKRKSKK